MEQSPASGVRLSLDLTDPSAVPCFMWDEPVTLAEVRRRLATAPPPERRRLLGRILRDTRASDVWQFASPTGVAAIWPELAPHLERPLRHAIHLNSISWRQGDRTEEFWTDSTVDGGGWPTARSSRFLPAAAPRIPSERTRTRPCR